MEEQYGIALALVDVVHAQPVGVEPVGLERIVRKRGEALVRCAKGVDPDIFAAVRESRGI